MKYYSHSDAGIVRNHNEDDHVIVENLNGEILGIVADGMGGHNAGEVASGLAIKYLGSHWASIESIGSLTDAANWIYDSSNEINKIILTHSRGNRALAGMGTTLVLTIITKDFVLISNIGDSRAYLCKNNELFQITRDHSFVQTLVDKGQITQKEAENHPKKNILTKALGTKDKIDLDIFSVDENIDCLLLCSDGLTNMVSNEEIEHTISVNNSPDDIVRVLIKKANKNGGEDNITVMLFMFEAGDYKC